MLLTAVCAFRKGGETSLRSNDVWAKIWCSTTGPWSCSEGQQGTSMSGAQRDPPFSHCLIFEVNSRAPCNLRGLRNKVQEPSCSWQLLSSLSGKRGLTGAKQVKPSAIDQRTAFCSPLAMGCYGLCWDRQHPQLHPPTRHGLRQGLTWAPKVITKCMFCSFFIIKWFPRALFVPGMILILYINSFNLYLHPVE